MCEEGEGQRSSRWSILVDDAKDLNANGIVNGGELWLYDAVIGICITCLVNKVC